MGFPAMHVHSEFFSFILLFLYNRLNQRSFGETKSRGDHRWIVVSPASYGRNRLMKKQTNGGHAGFRPGSDELINTAKLNPNQKRNETGRRRPDEMGGLNRWWWWKKKKSREFGNPRFWAPRSLRVVLSFLVYASPPQPGCSTHVCSLLLALSLLFSSHIPSLRSRCRLYSRFSSLPPDYVTPT